MRTLKDFLDIHAGETAWIFGKGPSFTPEFDFGEVGPLRCAINDVIKAVPDCRYGFANDDFTSWRHVYRPTHTVFCPSRTIQAAFLDSAKAPEIVYFDDEYDDGRFGWSAKRRSIVGLAKLPGTLCSALQVIQLMGARKLVCVGIDGGGGWSTRETWLTERRLRHGSAYDLIRNAFISAAARFGMPIQFYGQPVLDVPVTRPAGSPNMTLVKIISSTFLRTAPLREGMIVELPDEDARAAIRYGRAVRYTPPPDPAPLPPEVAAVAPDAETATAAPPRIRARRKLSAT